MTHFLEVGSMREELGEILESAKRLRKLLSITPDQRLRIEKDRIQQGDMTTIADEIQATLGEILEQTEEMVNFLDRFESSPVIYTGPGSTQEVMALLQRLVAIGRDSGEKL